MHEKGKMKISNNMEEQSCKFRADPLIEKAVMAIEAKRHQCDNRIVRRQKEKKRMEESKKELHELREQLQKEHELRQQENEVQKQQI